MFFSRRLQGLLAICWMAALAAGVFTARAQAQVVPSATSPRHSLWVGGEYSNVRAGFPYDTAQRLFGMGVFGTYSLTGHIGVEADARFLRFNSYYGETEDNYLAGPFYQSRRFGNFQPYARCLAGMGKIQFPFSIGSNSYFAVAPGAGVNYRIGRKWLLRGEYEYQFWPGSPNFSNEPAHEIAPSGFHAGIAYRLFR